MSEESQTRFTSSTFFSILLICFGLMGVALPFVMSRAIVIVIGWLILFSGGIQFVNAVGSKATGHIIWKLLVASTYLVAGVYFLRHPLLGIAALALAVGLFFVAEGLMDLAAYYQNRRKKDSRWMLFDSIATLLLGSFVWLHWPFSSLWISILVGISMISTGVTRLMLGLRTESKTEI